MKWELLTATVMVALLVPMSLGQTKNNSQPSAPALALFGPASISTDSPKLTIRKPAGPLRSNARSNHSSPFARVSALAQGRISATLGRDIPSYQMRTKLGVLRAENARNALTADFGSQSIAVRSGNTKWEMSLQGYGYGEAVKQADSAVPKATFNRVEYEREIVTKWYVNGP